MSEKEGREDESVRERERGKAGCPLSFETGGTMGYNCCFFLNFVPLHIESPYNFGGTGPILGVKKNLCRG
jgi:hypothetical protein